MASEVKSFDVAIIGAGFGGLGTGIELKKRGIESFVIFEGEEDVGGSWRTNTYPGCACDVPSHLYSYSFEPYPEWTEAFSPQEDIKKYIEHCADKYGLRPHIRFSTRVERMEFDEPRGVWQITTTDGDLTEARVLVPATGALSHPLYPDVAGRDEFEGTAVHAARWDSSVQLAGKRIGVLGSGASAIQVVPSVAKVGGHVSVFQRTASWVLPKNNQVYTEKQKARWRRWPWTQLLIRYMQYWLMETALPALLWFPRMLKVGEGLHKRELARTVSDPELRKKLTPNYNVGCKRTLVSDEWFPAFARDNVSLVTDGIERITPKGIRTTDGVEHELDILIYCTGYEIGAPAYPYEIRGIGGITLSEFFGAQRKAYYGMSVPHFPNMLMIMGPNSGPGHTSVLIYQEAQFKYIAKFTQHLLKAGAKYMDAKEDVVQRQFEAFQRRMRNSSWLSGCKSWYLNEDGTNSTMWPGFSFEYVHRTRRLRLDAYRIVAAPTAQPGRLAADNQPAEHAA